jgi:hypothetical protein
MADATREASAATPPLPEPSSIATGFQTHWRGCWQHRGHHDCAIARVRELEARAEPDGAPASEERRAP